MNKPISHERSQRAQRGCSSAEYLFCDLCTAILQNVGFRRGFFEHRGHGGEKRSQRQSGIYKKILCDLHFPPRPLRSTSVAFHSSHFTSHDLVAAPPPCNRLWLSILWILGAQSNERTLG